MSQQIALIVHQVMDAPYQWSEKKDGTITNGYYEVALDGARYGMGAASYVASEAEKGIFLRAINIWKEETGWQPKEVKAADGALPSGRVSIAPDAYIRSSYEEFTRAIRAIARSFTVHGESGILSAQIQTALENLDKVLRPMERIEGKGNATGGGVSGA